MHAATTTANARRSPSRAPREPRRDAETRDAGDRGHGDGDGDRRAEAAGDGRERDAAHRVDVLDDPEQLRVVGEALEADQRPGAEDEARPRTPTAQAAARNRRVRSSQTTSGQTKSFAATATPTASPTIARPIAVAPRERDGQHEQHREVPVEQAVDHDRRGERERRSSASRGRRGSTARRRPPTPSRQNQSHDAAADRAAARAGSRRG